MLITRGSYKYLHHPLFSETNRAYIERRNGGHGHENKFKENGAGSA